MQTFVNRCERRLFFGPMGVMKEMKGKMTQMDIKVKLGTSPVQLDVDDRTLRYVGHLCRLPEDRLEVKILRGLIANAQQMGSKYSGTDLWWDRVRRLVREILEGNPPGEKWYDIAKDRDKWRKMRYDWKQRRILLERGDTQEARQEKWNSVADRCLAEGMLEKIWRKVLPPCAVGTPLEGTPVDVLKRIVLAGGVQKNGWNERALAEWKAKCSTESAKMWLEHQGSKVRSRIQKWTLDSICELEIENTFVIPVCLNAVPPPPPPPPPPAAGSIIGRRLRGKQSREKYSLNSQ